MQTPPTLAAGLDSVEQLSTDEQEELVAIVRRRLADRRRARLAAEVAEARAEYGRGQAQPASADELVAEVLG